MNRIIFDTGEKIQGAGAKIGRRSGFTIVELLIVIVVIGILAAISIVAYSGIQNRANDTAVKNDLANIAKKTELFKVDFDMYPRHEAIELTTALTGVSVSKGAYSDGYDDNNLVYCVSADRQTAAFVAWSKSGQGFMAVNGSVSKTSMTPTTLLTICPALVNVPYGVWIYSWGSWANYLN